jgi:hypothetical protein
MVLKTVNCFQKLYYSFLHARLISDYPNPAIVSRSKLGGTGIRHHQVTGIMPASESRHRNTADFRNPAMDRNRPNLAKMAGIRPDMTGSGH